MTLKDQPHNASAVLILQVFEKLQRHYGHFDWWHRDRPYEVMLGAILVQNTNWLNAEKALRQLSSPLKPQYIADTPEAELAQLIRPSGYYNQKAKKLKALTQWFSRYRYDINSVRRVDKALLREELLAIHGVGHETADAILVYAIRKPSFIIDAYTRRIFERNGLKIPKGYEQFKALMEHAIPPDTERYAYYHGLMVEHAQQYCLKRPKCEICPLQKCCIKAGVPQGGNLI